jgi:hypothetical protein
LPENSLVPNVAEGNSVDLNLLDAGFTATAQSDSTGHIAPPNDDSSDENGETDSQSLDAAFELLVNGDLASRLL